VRGRVRVRAGCVVTTFIDPECDVTVREPGVYELSDEAYHADPVPAGSLSSSGARRLLPPSCPALFRYWADHREPPKAEYDFGHAAHKVVLGAGPDTVVIDAADWRTKAAKAERDEAYAAGKVPILRHEHEHVLAMARALAEHPVAKVLFDSLCGKPEQSLFWIDGAADIWRRARLDWLPEGRGGRLIIPDYKTTSCASREALERSVASFGYHQQAAWYLDGVTALGLGNDPAFLFVAQEKTPPYLVNVVELDAVALRIGRDLNRDAMAIYAECAATGRWPGYADDVELVSLPRWVTNNHLQEVW
jgi:hypothetical protein